MLHMLTAVVAVAKQQMFCYHRLRRGGGMCRNVKVTWCRVSKAARLFVHYFAGFLEYKWAYTGPVRRAHAPS